MPDPEKPLTISDFRPNLSILKLATSLGPLAELVGTWKGTGFNLIARPNFQNHNDIFLELNLTEENLKFTNIGGNVPNRSEEQHV